FSAGNCVGMCLLTRLHTAWSESQEYRLGLQTNAPGFPDVLLDALFQGEHIPCRRPATIHDSQCVLAAHSNTSLAVSLSERGVLHQPCRRDFSLRCKRRLTMDLLPALGCPFRVVVVLSMRY